MIVKTSLGEYTIGGIYKHWKGNYYKIVCIAKLHDSHNIYIICYHQCDINGIYMTIRENIGTPNEVIVHQPFATHETRWHDEVEVEGVKQHRFKLIKQN